MPRVRARSIPTVSEAVERFLELASPGSRREHASVLFGPLNGRVIGRKAAGPTLARSELGSLRIDRVSGEEFARWFRARHEGLAPSSEKRGRSSLKCFLEFAIANGWVDGDVLLFLPKTKASPPRRDWLRPEQVVALDALVTQRNFTPEQCLQWRILLDTGVRVDELIRMQPQALNAIDHVLVVTGKNQDLRRIPVSDEFCEKWQDYVLERRLRPSTWMFPSTGVRYVGPNGQMERVVLDASRHCSAKAVQGFLSESEKSVLELARKEAQAGRLSRAELPEKLYPHMLRRTYATNNIIASALLGAGYGMDLRSLQEAMGHKSLEVTAMYLSDVAEYINRHRRPASTVEAAVEVVRLTRNEPEASFARSG